MWGLKEGIFMKLNEFNRASLIHIAPYKRKSQDFDALVLFFQVEGTKHKVQRTFNIPTDFNSKCLLNSWFKTFKINVNRLDLKNPLTLSKQLYSQAKDKPFYLYLAISNNKKYINIEDFKPYIK